MCGCDCGALWRASSPGWHILCSFEGICTSAKSYFASPWGTVPSLRATVMLKACPARMKIALHRRRRVQVKATAIELRLMQARIRNDPPRLAYQMLHSERAHPCAEDMRLSDFLRRPLDKAWKLEIRSLTVRLPQTSFGQGLEIGNKKPDVFGPAWSGLVDSNACFQDGGASKTSGLKLSGKRLLPPCVQESTHALMHTVHFAFLNASPSRRDTRRNYVP